MFKTAAAVILFNPDLNVIDNLKTYINQVEKLYVIDNSETYCDPVIEKIKSLNNPDYTFNKSNLGIAAALNIAANKAIKEGYEYLLTMDQDSKASPGMVSKLREIMLSAENIGIVTADHTNPELHESSIEKRTEEILYTMTNGNLLNLKAYQATGDFLEPLFIDHVDHEYCLRLNKNNFKVIKTNQAIVYHKLGSEKRKKLFSINFYPTYHAPVRLYYRTRNRFYIDRMYKKTFPHYVREDRKHFFRELIDMIICEKELLKKISMIIRGYLDYRKNILGKFQNPDGK